MKAVMPDAGSFEELTDVELTGTLTAIYKADNGGFVVTAAPGGFGGAVDTMVGIDPEGIITGLRVTKHAETPGLGANATAPDFYEQFTGMSGTLAVTKDGGEVVPITSSTITSRAVTSGANEALEWFAANGGAY
jgi:H+/Na+-translocating ferredoxin:NAD+ oxidoreductase subunit G